MLTGGYGGYGIKLLMSLCCAVCDVLLLSRHVASLVERCTKQGTDNKGGQCASKTVENLTLFGVDVGRSFCLTHPAAKARDDQFLVKLKEQL